MKKILSFMLFVAVSSVALSQDLQVDAGGNVFVSSDSYVFVGGNLSVDGAGSVMVKSDAANSGSLIVSGISSGNVTYERHIPRTNWHLVSSPVNSQSIADFATNVANDVKKNGDDTFYGISFYDNSKTAGTRWQYYETGTGTPVAASSAGAASGSFVSGKGYSMLRGSVGAYTFTGGLATGDVVTSASVASTPVGHDWVVIGNPYMSYLAGNTPADASNVLSANESVLKTGMKSLYFWDGTDFQAVNHSDSALNLLPGQAFAVEFSGAGQTFTFSSALQMPQPDGVIGGLAKSLPLTSVTLFLEKGKEKKYTRLRYLDKNATNGLDEGYDAGSFRSGQPTFSVDTHLVSGSTGKDFTIQCLPKTGMESTVVSLAVYADANATLSFRAESENLPEGSFVFLEDKENKTIKKISGDVSYTVTVNEKQNGIGRFYLHTASNVLSVNDEIALNDVSIYKASNTTLRIAGLQIGEDASVKIHTITGKEVVGKSFKTQNVNDIQLPKLSAGIYLVQLITDAGSLAKKIIIE